LSQPRDAASKGMADWDPVGFVKMVLWLSGEKIDAGISVVDSDLTTVNLTSDRLFRIEEESPWLLLVELLGYRDENIEGRLDCYSGYAEYKHNLPVRTIIILLAPTASRPSLNGYRERFLPASNPAAAVPYRTFRYGIIRLWEVPIEELLELPITMLPFAVLGRCDKNALPLAIGRMAVRIEHEATATEAAELWTYARLLIGIKFSKEAIAIMFPDYSQLQDSVTFQEIVQIGVEKGRLEGQQEGIKEGRLEEALRLLLKFGKKRLGEPPAEVQTIYAKITDPDVFEDLTDRLENAKSWQEMLP
jgi:hypothetical protein